MDIPDAPSLDRSAWDEFFQDTRSSLYGPGNLTRPGKFSPVGKATHTQTTRGYHSVSPAPSFSERLMAANQGHLTSSHSSFSLSLDGDSKLPSAPDYQLFSPQAIESTGGGFPPGQFMKQFREHKEQEITSLDSLPHIYDGLKHQRPRR